MPDHVVEDLRRREEQPPVEAHRAASRAGSPTGLLPTDGEAAVAQARLGTGGIEARPDLPPGLVTEPRLEGALAERGIVGNVKLVTVAAHPLLAGLRGESERLAEVGNGVRSAGEGVASSQEGGPTTFDPGGELDHRRSGVTLRGPGRKHDHHAAVGLDEHTDAVGPLRASHAVVHESPRVGWDLQMASFSPPPPRRLSSDAVALRPIAEWDIPEILIAHEDDRELARATGLLRPPSGAELGREVEDAPVAWAAGRIQLTVLEPGSEDCRGRVLIDAIDADAGTARVSVWIAPGRRGRGLASGALALARDWLARECGIEQLQCGENRPGGG
jgi:RimJ/RimL family protein N-acetyltransferase